MEPTTKSITLTPRELNKISQFLADTTNGTQFVIIDVNAELNGWTGAFTAVITDESNW